MPVKITQKEFDEYLKTLNNENSEIEALEKAIMILAHLSEKHKAKKVFKNLKKSNILKDEKLSLERFSFE
ncbi:MAG TPA: hypothetical protein PLM75_00080 [bacterium]|nr:hypothetical protein [bacterium]HPP86242.1 hypothetical protein [bacterium]